MKSPKTILITGASSGIGKALAISYAADGSTLYLTGRSKERLREVSKLLEGSGAIINTAVIDVTDSTAMENYINNIGKIDLVIANAGISGGTAGGGESEEQVRNIFKTNIDGVLNTILPAIKVMKKQKSGQIAIISSIAGFRGLPTAPAYSASKAAVKNYGEAIRPELEEFGIEVSVICPGYVKTPMTDVNNFPMPFIMSPKKAANIIKKGLEKNKARISFPLIMYLIMWMFSCLPPWLTDPIFRRLPKKG